MAINRIRHWYDNNRETCAYDEGELLKKILANVVGFDLNPLAVMAARTNYLVAVKDLIRHSDHVEIPIYLCDSIMTPAEYGDLFTGTGTVAKVPCSAMKPPHLLVPKEIAKSPRDVAKYAEVMEVCIKNGYEAQEFISRCQDEGLHIKATDAHISLYKELVRLDAENKNGIWARIIKNNFAPLFVGPVDFVAGNPPWVRWGYLPREYREDSVPMWQGYGLFSLKGFEARLGSGEKDLSQLFTYVSIDKYLKDSGKLGFLITKTVFKAKGQAEGFRRFRLGASGKPFSILRVDDLSLLKPFEGASNLTSCFVALKGKETEYPVPFWVWIPRTGETVPPDPDLREVTGATTIEKLDARPLSTQVGSQWQTALPNQATAFNKVLGRSYYKASGRRDGGLTREEALAHARPIAGAMDLPVSADLEKGFGDAPEVVAETIRLAAGAGLVGCTIEDTTGDPERPLYDFGLAVERIAAAAEAARALPFAFILTARTHNLLYAAPSLDETISRLQAFEKAGADVLFAPGLA